MRNWRSILEAGGARALAGVVNLGVLFVTTRHLGPAGQGTLVAAVTWAAFGSTVVGLSLGQVSHQAIQLRGSQDWMPALAGTLVRVALVSSAAGYCAVVAASWVGAGHALGGVPLPVMALGATLLPLTVLDEYSRNLLAASGEVRRYARALALGTAARGVLVVLAVGVCGLGVMGAVAGLVAGQALTVALEGAALLRIAGRRLRFEKAMLVTLLRGALRLHPNTVAAFLLPQANVLLLSRLASKAEVGWYQLGFQLVGVVVLLPQAAGMVLVGKLAAVGPDAAWPEQKRLMAQVLSLVTAFGVLGWLAAPPLITVVAGPGFEPTIEVFRGLLVLLLPLSMAELMAPQWYGRGLFAVTGLLTVVGAATNLVLSLVLISKHGIMGAVWGTAACYLVFGLLGQVAFAIWCETRYRRALRAVPSPRGEESRA